ncbi:MAG TPA: amidase [Solirubrobacterales bacterium]
MDAAGLAFAGISRQAELIRAGEVSSRELTGALLDRIGRLDPELNAFRVVMAEEALAEADARDGAAEVGRGPLHGVPVAIKDENDVAGQVTTFGGSSQSTPAAEDGVATARLRAAGAVIIGKTNLSEFGQWPFTESQTFGYTRNPWDPTRTAGGSSGGSAVATAAGMVGAALGGDGGGSIRIPAACCGLFGLKPQLGRVSFAPAPALWGGLGTIGPLTRRVEDSALFYDVVRGAAPGDRFQPPEPPMSFGEAARTEPGRLRIAVSTKPTVPFVGLDREQRAALESVAGTLRELGHEVGEADPDYPDTTAAFTPQYLGGVRTEAEMVEHPERLERRTKQTAAVARLLPRASFEWAIRRGVRQAAEVNAFFDDWDLLLTPTIPSQPRRLGALDGVGFLGAVVRSQPMVAYCAVWNLFGNPAASVPAGTSSAGLPLAVQLVGAPNDEPTILQAAAQLERELGWPERRPPAS